MRGTSTNSLAEANGYNLAMTDGLTPLRILEQQRESATSGADAVVSYLRKYGPKNIRETCSAVVAGGWRSEHPDAYWKLWDAIQYQLERSTNAKIISLGEGIIGLPEHKKSRKK